MNEKQVVINFTRPGKGVTRYVERLVDETPIRLKTFNRLTPDFSLKWCQENWWPNGYIPRGILICAIRKYIFYKKWFSVMQLLGPQDALLGHYVDIDTPVERSGGEYYLTDLFLDLWIGPDGQTIERDREEFEQAYRMELISPRQYQIANLVMQDLMSNVANGKFIQMLV